jgi:hypothetical protein
MMQSARAAADEPPAPTIYWMQHYQKHVEENEMQGMLQMVRLKRICSIFQPTDVFATEKKPTRLLFFSGANIQSWVWGSSFLGQLL